MLFSRRILSLLVLTIYLPLLALTLWTFSQIHQHYHLRLDEVLYLKTQEIRLGQGKVQYSNELPNEWSAEWLILSIRQTVSPGSNTHIYTSQPGWETWVDNHQQMISKHWGLPHTPWKVIIGQRPARCLMVPEKENMVCLSVSDEQLLATDEVWLVAVFFICIALSMGIILFFIHRGAVVPLNHLAEGCIQVARGNLSSRVESAKGFKFVEQGIQSFNKMARQLEVTKGHQQAMLASITHDLRTPLVAEKRVLGILSTQPDKAPDYIKGLQNNNAMLLRLTDDLLATCQWEIGIMPMQPTWCNLYETVQKVLVALYPLAEENSTTLNINLNSATQVWADPFHLERLLYNLVSNGIRHCPDKTKITILATQKDDFTEIMISDTGSGLPKNILEHYSTGHQKPFGNTRQRGIGDGLGLVVSEQIMAAHFGELLVLSNPYNANSKGTVWQARFPHERKPSVP